MLKTFWSFLPFFFWKHFNGFFSLVCKKGQQKRYFWLLIALNEAYLCLISKWGIIVFHFKNYFWLSTLDTFISWKKIFGWEVYFSTNAAHLYVKRWKKTPKKYFLFWGHQKKGLFMYFLKNRTSWDLKYRVATKKRSKVNECSSVANYRTAMIFFLQSSQYS